MNETEMEADKRKKKTPEQLERAKQRKEKARLEKINESDKRQNKKQEKMDAALSPTETFTFMWNAFVAALVGMWETAVFIGTAGMAFINLSGHLSGRIVDLFGDGSDENKKHNHQVLESALTYILMLIPYIFAGITGIFVYKMKNAAGERLFSVDNSPFRQFINSSCFMYYATKSWLPPWLPFKFLQHTDAQNSRTNNTSAAKWLNKMPHIAAYYASVLLMIAFSPSLHPSTASMIIAALFIAFYVLDTIVEKAVGISITESLKTVRIKPPNPTQKTTTVGGANNTTQPQQAVDERLIIAAEKMSEQAEKATKTNDMMANSWLSKGIPGYIALAIFALFQIALGLLSVIPAAYLSSFYIWFVAFFSFAVHGATLSDLFRELEKDSTTRYGDKFRLGWKGFMRIFVDWKGTITGMICAFISLCILTQMKDDPALYLLTSFSVVCAGLAMGLMADGVMRWYENNNK